MCSCPHGYTLDSNNTSCVGTQVLYIITVHSQILSVCCMIFQYSRIESFFSLQILMSVVVNQEYVAMCALIMLDRLCVRVSMDSLSVQMGEDVKVYIYTFIAILW